MKKKKKRRGGAVSPLPVVTSDTVREIFLLFLKSYTLPESRLEV